MRADPRTKRWAVLPIALSLLATGCSGGDGAGTGGIGGSTSPDVDGTSVVSDDPQAVVGSVPAAPVVTGSSIAPEPRTIETVAPAGSVLAVLRSRPDLSRLVELVDVVGSDAVFQQARGVTVLAPVDEAWATYDDEAWSALLADRDAAALVLSEHLAIGATTIDALVEGGQFVSAMARRWDVVGGDPTRIGPAVVLDADISATNGFVHVIDTVLAAPD